MDESKKRPLEEGEGQLASKRAKVEPSETNAGEAEEAPAQMKSEEVSKDDDGNGAEGDQAPEISGDIATSSSGALPQGPDDAHMEDQERGYWYLGSWYPMTHEKPLPVGEGTGLVYDERMCDHVSLTDETHPESPMRIKSIYNMLVERKLAQRCIRVEAREATNDELRTVHSESYRQIVDAVKNLGEMPLKSLERMYDSIYLNKKSGEAARLSAGSTVEIVNQVVEGKLRNGVAVVRPPGHHAEQHASKGFCFFNNVAIAAKWAVEKLGVKRVLILDWDIHHGNGTQHMFEDDKRVLYYSVHRYDHGSFYPGSSDGGPRKVGNAPAEGYNMNVGWNGGGMGDGDYIGMFHQLLLPVAYEFAPQLVLISAGFDSARGDPLGGCDISPTGFAHMTHSLMALAQGKVVLVLEGGYNLSAISHSFAACTSVMLGDPPRMLGRLFPSKRATRAIRDTKRYHAPYWTCCSQGSGFELMRFPMPMNGGLDEEDDEEDEDYSEGGGKDEEEEEEDGEAAEGAEPKMETEAAPQAETEKREPDAADVDASKPENNAD